MAASFTIQIKGLDKLQRVFKELPRRAQKEVSNEFRAIGEEWVGLARRDAPADRGRLRGSINYNVNDLTLELGAQARHAAYSEFGTGAQFEAPSVLSGYAAQFKGSDEGGDPIANLTAWVKRKGLNKPTFNVRTRRKTFANREAAARSIAFAIFKKRQRVGSEPHPFLFTGVDGSDRLTQMTNKLEKNLQTVLTELI